MMPGIKISYTKPLHKRSNIKTTTAILVIKFWPETRESPTRLSVPGAAVAQSVERATPGEEVVGSISAVAARSQLVESMSV